MDDLDVRLDDLAAQVRDAGPPAERADLERRVRRHVRTRRATGAVAAAVVLVLVAAVAVVARPGDSEAVRTVDTTAPASTAPSTAPPTTSEDAPTTAARPTTTTATSTVSTPVATTSPSTTPAAPPSTPALPTSGTIHDDSYAEPYTLTWTRTGRTVRVHAEFSRGSGGSGTADATASLDSARTLPALVSQDLIGDWLVLGFASPEVESMYLLLNHVDPFEVDVHPIPELGISVFIGVIGTSTPPRPYEWPVTLGPGPDGGLVELNP